MCQFVYKNSLNQWCVISCKSSVNFANLILCSRAESVIKDLDHVIKNPIRTHFHRQHLQNPDICKKEESKAKLRRWEGKPESRLHSARNEAMFCYLSYDRPVERLWQSLPNSRHRDFKRNRFLRRGRNSVARCSPLICNVRPYESNC
jgi:hypothetical protein